METDNTDFICRDSAGNTLEAIEKISEEELSAKPSFTHCLAVVKVGEEYLLGLNGWRKRYEIFGGCVERGETARRCILRECSEELGFDASDITYLGAMRLKLKPDYFSQEERVEYGGLYGITLPNMPLDVLYARVADKDEITRLAFYSDIKGREPISEIDESLIYHYS